MTIVYSRIQEGHHHHHNPQLDLELYLNGAFATTTSSFFLGGGRSDFVLFFFFFCVALVCACFWIRARMMMMMFFDMVPWEVICYDLIQELDEINQQQPHWQWQQCLLTSTMSLRAIPTIWNGFVAVLWIPMIWNGFVGVLWLITEGACRHCQDQWLKFWTDYNSLVNLRFPANFSPSSSQSYWPPPAEEDFVDGTIFFSFCLLTSLRAFLPSVLCLCLLLGVHGQLVNLTGSVYWVVGFLCLHGLFMYMWCGFLVPDACVLSFADCSVWWQSYSGWSYWEVSESPEIKQPLKSCSPVWLTDFLPMSFHSANRHDGL